MTRVLRHNRVDLALHELRSGSGRPLLALHGLAERSPRRVPPELEDWPGPVFALDFTGHGDSTLPEGGGYTAEILMADADIALASLGSATVVGRGLGAYVALLLCGARPALVRGAILRDGPGLAGGPERPGTPQIAIADPAAVLPPDPFALAELASDVRPGDYALGFVHHAMSRSSLESPLRVCALERPEWLKAVVAVPGVEVCTLGAALQAFAAEA